MDIYIKSHITLQVLGKNCRHVNVIITHYKFRTFSCGNGLCRKCYSCMASLLVRMGVEEGTGK